jgi:hypothetical protein
MRGAPDVREAVGVERVDIQHGNACRGLGAPFGVVQRKHLHAGAAIALTPWQALVTISRLRVGRAVQRTTSMASVFAVAALFRGGRATRRQAKAGVAAAARNLAARLRRRSEKACVGRRSCAGAPGQPRFGQAHPVGGAQRDQVVVEVVAGVVQHAGARRRGPFRGGAVAVGNEAVGTRVWPAA